MRRMRDLTIGHYVAAAVPVLAAGFGIYYVVRHHQPALKSKESAALIKPSQFEREGSRKGSRKIALAKDHERVRNAGTSEERDSNDLDKDNAVPKERGERSKDAPRDSRKPSSELEAMSNDAVAIGADCEPIEFRGAGPQATKVTKGEWTAVMEQFHGAKHAILAMLEKRRHDLPEVTAQALEHQIRNLKIQRPPASDEPDLSWRGIGIYTQNSEGEPMVKMGGGFVHLVTKHPARAKFEMARLVAQSLAPCELKRIGANEGTWMPLLKCLGMNESQGCGQGTFSESGWAVSTTVAAVVAAPGCHIPAFKSAEMASCVSKIPLSKTMVQMDEIPSSDDVPSSAAAPIIQGSGAAEGDVK